MTPNHISERGGLISTQPWISVPMPYAPPIQPPYHCYRCTTSGAPASQSDGCHPGHVSTYTWRAAPCEAVTRTRGDEGDALRDPREVLPADGGFGHYGRVWAAGVPGAGASVQHPRDDRDAGHDGQRGGDDQARADRAAADVSDYAAGPGAGGGAQEAVQPVRGPLHD